MDQSQYLVAALRDMQGQQSAPQQQGPDLGAMQKQAQARQAWEAANPGQSYMGHMAQQMGQNVQQAPGNVSAGLGRLFGQQPAAAPAQPIPQQSGMMGLGR